MTMQEAIDKIRSAVEANDYPLLYANKILNAAALIEFHEENERRRQKPDMKVEYRMNATCVIKDPSEIPNDAEIISVDGRDFIARCEVCRAFICEGDVYSSCEDSVYFCSKCSNKEL